MNKTKKQSPKNSPVRLDTKDLKEVSGGGGGWGGLGGGGAPGGITLN